MVDADTADFFGKQQEDTENRICCDSGTACPQWASVSHGIYISIEASGVHRSLGVAVSSVQSTTMDSWKPIHRRMMELGGNSRFKNFLREQGIPDSMPIRQKYNTRAAEWYRQHLRALAEGAKSPEPLPPNTGHLPQSGESSPEQLMLDKLYEGRGAVARPRGKATAARSTGLQNLDPVNEDGAQLLCNETIGASFHGQGCVSTGVPVASYGPSLWCVAATCVAPFFRRFLRRSKVCVP
mmetsp:Transcript_55593/g.107236  ORF Transcript_55593/g.107236 Transcript_55593/m.107236 type:complete len:239 (+) Transcript_55593:65-781(+)